MVITTIEFLGICVQIILLSLRGSGAMMVDFDLCALAGETANVVGSQKWDPV
jgi:hypothetical protein